MKLAIGLVKLGMVAAVAEVDDKAEEQPDDQPNLGGKRQAGDEVQAAQNA